MTLLTLLLILLILAALFGGYGSTRGWGYYGWSPVGLLIIVLVLLWALGGLR